MKHGSLCGNGKQGSDLQGDASIKVGDRVGVLIDTEGEGRVLFFKNGLQFGPGFVGGVSGRVLLGVQMYSQGCQCTLLPDAEEPAEPFTKWEGYREGDLIEEEEEEEEEDDDEGEDEGDY